MFAGEEMRMTLEKLISVASRALFLGAFILLAVAVGEKIVNLLGYTILQQTQYGSWRLLEFAALFVIFVIAMLLREIREELKKTKAI
jgi:hypothetical protein